MLIRTHSPHRTRGFVGITTALVITGMDIYSLPDALKEAWHIIIGM